MGAEATIYQDSDNVLALIVYTDSTETVVRDLTGHTIDQYRLSDMQNVKILELTATPNVNGSVVAFGVRTSGEVNITIDNLDVTASPRLYRQQLTLSDSSGNKQVVLDGYLNFRRKLL